MEEKDIIGLNLVKWQTLPAGQRRESVGRLLSLESEDLLSFYRDCIVFWEKERGWEYEKYSGTFLGRSVLEIGSGLGYDGITYSKSVQKWTFCDVIPQNLAFVSRITEELGVQNTACQIIEDVAGHDFGEQFDGFYAHGVLHHVPFEIAQQEINNIDRFLRVGSKVVVLMYPYERWEMCGKPSFETFGCMTDGDGTPWAEYYDEEKIQKLFGSGYQLDATIKWGADRKEFVNYELTKK